jgi:thiamine transport system ATP-binding protein
MGGLDVRDLTVRFGATTAVDHVDLTVPAGSVVAVLGPSGCGKSTLLRAVAGLEAVASGSVSYDGRDLAGTPTHRRGFALMFQDGQLFEHLDVAANIAYPLRLRRRRRTDQQARTRELLALVGLEGYADRLPATLSGGERQRVALARALAVAPRLLLLDEPLSALDRGLRERLAGELHDILREAGATAMLVTHDHEEAFAVADRMAVMREGRIVQTGSLAEVWSRPVDGWTAAFLGYATVLDGDRAARLCALVSPGEQWTCVALRRSALRVDPAGPLTARVEQARVTPEQIRLQLDVDGFGSLPGVADPGSDVRVGARVPVAIDTSRLAFIPSELSGGGP